MLDDSRASLGLHMPVDIMEEETRQDEPGHVNDDLDDVFGSAPPSPTGDTHPSNNTSWLAPGNLEPSDVPRLKEKHETEGYRDGVTKGKAESVQAGFDEGYGLGAVLGLRIGKILGLLEGIVGGLKAEGYAKEKLRVEALFEQAQKDLSTQSVFGKEWWGEDGIWKFEVHGEKDGEVVFPDVAKAHPLVVKWEAVIAEEVRRWGLDLEILDGDQEGLEEMGGQGAVAKEMAKGEAEGEPVAAGMAKVLGILKKDLNW